MAAKKISTFQQSRLLTQKHNHSRQIRIAELSTQCKPPNTSKLKGLIDLILSINTGI